MTWSASASGAARGRGAPRVVNGARGSTRGRLEALDVEAAAAADDDAAAAGRDGGVVPDAAAGRDGVDFGDVDSTRARFAAIRGEGEDAEAPAAAEADAAAAGKCGEVPAAAATGADAATASGLAKAMVEASTFAGALAAAGAFTEGLDFEGTCEGGEAGR